MRSDNEGKAFADEEKTVKEQFDDSIAAMLWLRIRFRALREGYNDALGKAEKLWTEIEILKDFLLTSEALDEGEHEKIEAMTGHIAKAYSDLRAALETAKRARPIGQV